MTPTKLHALPLLAIFITVLAPIAHGQTAPLSAGSSNSVPPLIQQMVGTWTVQQRMWPGSDAGAINLPSAIARRVLRGDAFLGETMELSPGSKQEPFTRIAYFNYNAVNQQYEYFSLDSRAPQMMNEKSYEGGVQGKLNNQGTMSLFGGIFIAPKWGNDPNKAFRYRLTISEVEKDRQVIQLFFTPLSADGAKEFLAFEYTYSRAASR